MDRRGNGSERFQRTKSKSVFDGLLEDSSPRLRMTVGGWATTRGAMALCSSAFSFTRLRRERPHGGSLKNEIRLRRMKSLCDEVHQRWMKSDFVGFCRGDQWSPEFRRFFAKAQNDVGRCANISFRPTPQGSSSSGAKDLDEREYQKNFRT